MPDKIQKPLIFFYSPRAIDTEVCFNRGRDRDRCRDRMEEYLIKKFRFRSPLR